MHTERPLPAVAAGVLCSLKIRMGADIAHRKTGSRIQRTSGFISLKPCLY
jgi:hypothetical protein